MASSWFLAFGLVSVNRCTELGVARSGLLALCAVLITVSGCKKPGLRPFPPDEPMWLDPDQRPFADQPEENFSPYAWDAGDQTLFRPVTRWFLVRPGGEAWNVNALDEVPDSSWFRNRIGHFAMTPEEVALGPCDGPPLDPSGPWTVTDAKPNGANPGFFIEDQRGRRFLLKFDGIVQGPRATAADVLVSKLYFAAGYYVPCNEIVFFERSILEIDSEAEGETKAGKKEPLTSDHLDTVFDKGLRLEDGRYRASASLFIDGKPIGPWRYEGRRRDDPNDVVKHQDRRELRGARVLAAWTNHFDSREQNTMSAWMDAGNDRGYVRHYYIDFGDCLGSLWEPPMLGRRLRHSSYFDPAHIGADFVTLGAIERPWDTTRFGPSGPVFAYYRVSDFDPEAWHPGYPNPAFARMTERDAAWMARIISQFSDEHLRAVIGTARLQNSFLEAELFRLLRGRRDLVLQRYLKRLSPLGMPEVRDEELCLRDYAIEGGVVPAERRRYGARAWSGKHPRPLGELGRFTLRDGSRACVPLSRVSSAARDAYVIVDVHAGAGEEPLLPPARVHLYRNEAGAHRVVGLERPEDSKAPGRTRRER